MIELKDILKRNNNSIPYDFKSITILLSQSNTNNKVIVSVGYKEEREMTIKQVLNKIICEIGGAMGEAPYPNSSDEIREYDRLEKIIDSL